MPKKIRSHGSIQNGSRMFTDREEPRQAFWEKYRAVKGQLHTDGDIHVLTYYGVGGIGKTSLLKQLMLEMDRQLPSPRYVYLDLDKHHDCHTVLNVLKNMLGEKYHYSFPLFEIGNYVYAKKLGEKPDSPQIRQLTEKSPALRFLVKFMGNIPVVDILPKLFEVADEGVALLRNYLKDHSHELARVELLDQEELKAYLPVLFARDLTRNLEKTEEPLVILLDTYEKLVNELSDVGFSLGNDWWLRENNGLIPQIPNTLWVIAGREKLRWERFDPEWADTLQQHVLGSLSEKDSDLFLCTAGILSGKLRTELYELTAGTPVYLDLCVDRYIRCREKGETPDIGDFGSNTYELIERFVRYMSDGEKDLVYALACLQKWDDDLIWELGEKILPGFSVTLYEKTKELSFVIQSEDSSYNLHQTVGDVLSEHCPKMLKQRVCEATVRHFEEKLPELSPSSDGYIQALEYMLHGLILLYPDREALREAYDEKIKKPLNDLQAAGRLDAAEALLNILAPIATKNKLDLLYAGFLSEMAWLAYRKRENKQICLALAARSVVLHTLRLGQAHEKTVSSVTVLAAALQLADKKEEAMELDRRVRAYDLARYGQTHKKTIHATNNLVGDLLALKKYEQALPMAQGNLKMAEENLPANDPAILTAMGNLGMVFEKLRQYEDAQMLYRETLARREENIVGPHPSIALSMGQLARVLERGGQDGEALDLRKKALEIYTETLGEKHPTTMGARGALVRLLEKKGDYRQAGALLRITLATYVERYGESDFMTVKMRQRIRELEAHLDPNAVIDEVQVRAGWDMNKFMADAKKFGTKREIPPGYTEQWSNDYDLLLHVDTVYRKGKELGTEHPETVMALIDVVHSLARYGYRETVTALAEVLLEGYLQEEFARRGDVTNLLFAITRALRKADQRERAVQWDEEKVLPRLQEESAFGGVFLHAMWHQLYIDYTKLNQPEKAARYAGKLQGLTPEEVESTKMFIVP